MSVKYRITLLVTAAGFIASLLFSAVILYESIEQPYAILDMELREETGRAVELIEINQEKSKLEAVNPHILDTFPTWLKIYKYNSERVLFKSKLADQISLPTLKPGLSTTVDAVVHDEKINFGQGRSNKAAFRTQTFERMANDKKIRVQVALPMVKLKEEIQELFIGIFAGLIFSTLALILISYFIADRILKPIGDMKDLALNITVKNLDQRIPVEKEKGEFNELAKTINMMLDRLQLSFVKQRDFLFDTSHELKTPLTTIRLAIDEISSSEDMAALDPSLKENFLRVNNQAVRMEKLVKDLLNLSALEKLYNIEAKPVNLSELLTNLIDEYRFLAEGRNIVIEISMPKELVILGDEEKLNRALSNILDNALKYNIDGGRIEITITSSDGGFYATIGNSGPGVPEDEIPRIFDQFYRVDKSRSTNYGGFGLGLAMAKRIIELHGGRIDFESREEEWTKVMIMLPRSPVETADLKDENSEYRKKINKRNKTLDLKFYLVVAVLSIFAGVAFFMHSDSEQAIKMEDLPPIVKSSVEKEIAGHKIKEVVKETKGSKIRYIIIYDHDGTEMEIEYTPSGKLIFKGKE